MADKRINALANTASSTASDDFIAVDGTTNGTRKLNAFSPTFGGNATVTGTLTVNGNSASVASANGTTDSLIRSTVSGTASTGKGIFSSYLTGLIEWQFGALSSDSSFRISSSGLGTSDRFSISSTGVVSVLATTASTTTSSGALVVGNGTSGGLGVGGAIYAGGAITVSVGFGVAATLGLNQTGVASAYLTQKATSGDLALGNGGGDQLTIAKATGNATFSGSVQTSAPTGGTSAAWKLGTVATVSPTSPNRTIEVDIGGTIYYLAAKTTNN